MGNLIGAVGWRAVVIFDWVRRNLIPKATETGGEFNTCVFPWLSHPHEDMRPKDLPFLVPSYPLHSKITFWCICTRKLREQRFSFKFLICYKTNSLLCECAAHREVSSLKILVQKGSSNGLDLNGTSPHPTLPFPALSVCLMSTIDWA